MLLERAALCFALALGVSGCRDSTDGSAPPDASPDAPALDAADEVAAGPEVPHLRGDWWTVATTPDLGPLNADGEQPVDFAIWQAPDGSWQLWSCIRGTLCGAGDPSARSRLFYHWEGASLTDTAWHPEGIAMQSDPSAGETPCGLQAPFVLQAEGAWRMFYGDWTAICEATGADGKHFARVLDAAGHSALFDEQGTDTNTRDPMVLRDGDHYVVYCSASPGGHGGVYARTSTDLRGFSSSRLVAYGGQAGDDPYAAECPFVVHRGAYYYLFRTQHYGASAQTSVYRSTDPMDFGVNDDRDFVERLPVAAPEVFTYQGESYVAALLPTLAGIHVSHLDWSPAP